MQIKIWLKEKKEKFAKKYYAWKAKRKLLSKKQEDIAVFDIMEAYVTEKILGGEEHRREELAQLQKKMEEFKMFIKFLKKL